MPNPEGDVDGQADVVALRRGLQDLGWTEGRNIHFEIRWTAGNPYKTRSFAKELIGMKPDLIVPSSNLVTSIMQQETHIIPMVFINVGIRSAAALLRAWRSRAETSPVSPF